MSRSPGTSRPASSSPQDGSNQAGLARPPPQPQATAPRPPQHAGEDASPTGTTSSTAVAPSSTQHLPSPTAMAGSSAPRTSRASDVHSILNPSPLKLEPLEFPPPRRGSGPLESPPSTLSTPQYTPSSLSRPALPDRGSETPPAPIAGEGQPIAPSHMPRRILTPKSPGMRAASMSRVGVPGTINAQKSPFLPQGRTYTVEPGYSQGSEVPPIPTPPAHSRLSGSSYGFPSSAPTPPLPNRRLSAGTTQASQSQSTSPTTSYSSYSQPSHTSPAPQYGSSGNQPGSAAFYQPGASAASQLTNGSPVSVASGATYRSPGGALSQSSYQLLTLDTDQGPIQVPVDVQAASKVADDKRKRNAGASARFRQRRKEKEREASQTIAKLEQQIREITEEREFYRQERDHFRRLASGQVGPAPLGQRPPSPQHAQAAGAQEAAPRARQLSGAPWSDAGLPETAERIMRPRTDGYQPGQSFALPPLSTAAAPAYGPPSTMAPQTMPGHYPAMSGAESSGPSPTTGAEVHEQYPRRLQMPGPGYFPVDRR
ncbi:MAG: hypothetical protein M1832_004686 [Thelocarpon impressellum]|nr:MAG: hypothetical protein M1832_004686 [Thelocarpon impressellum]